MPIFEYVCQKCEHRFEAIVLGSKSPKCPKCESKSLNQQLSRFAVGGERSSGSSAADAAGACGTCGDPNGPGSCSVDDMD
ncbi:MAG TPA: zinc ribbon domain-containing protein [Candidatus Angelobacter sp.]